MLEFVKYYKAGITTVYQKMGSSMTKTDNKKVLLINFKLLIDDLYCGYPDWMISESNAVRESLEM